MTQQPLTGNALRRATVGIWAWGIVLFLLLVFIGAVLGLAAYCIDPAKTTQDELKFGACPYTLSLYWILRDWQTGIGAAIGLLGVAWSTFYKATLGKGD